MASEGPLSPATGTSETRTGGDAHWSNPGSISADDSSFALAELLSGGAESHWLAATDFGFSIPSGATIDGIVAEFLVRRVQPNTAFISSATIWLSGAPTGTAKGGVSIGDTFAYHSFGGAADDWGASLSDTDVNSTGFGVAFYVGSGASAVDIECDHVRVTVHYTEPNVELSGTSSATSSASASLSLGLNLSGTSAATSTGTASLTVTSTHDLSGTSAAVSSASADLLIGKIRELSGTSAAESGTSAALSLVMNLSGTSVATSEAGANLSFVLELSGTSAAQSGASGNLVLNPATLLVDAVLVDQDVGYTLVDQDVGYTLVEIDETHYVLKKVN